MMRGCNSRRLSTAIVAVLAFVYCASSSTARLREEPVMAMSADDVKFRNLHYQPFSGHCPPRRGAAGRRVRIHNGARTATRVAGCLAGRRSKFPR